MHALNKSLAGLANESGGGWELYAYNIAADRVQFVPQVCLRDMRYLRLYTYSIEYIFTLCVLFRASLKHKLQNASAETIVKTRNLTVQPPRDRRIEGKLLRWALIHEVWNLHFLLDPTFLPTRNWGQEVGESRPDYHII